MFAWSQGTVEQGELKLFDLALVSIQVVLTTSSTLKLIQIRPRTLTSVWNFAYGCYSQKVYQARTKVFLPIQLLWESGVKPLMHFCLGIHKKEPTVFLHTKPAPQLWACTTHSSMSEIGTDKFID